MPSPSAEDRALIVELYDRYSWALDTGDTDGYVALFTDDALVTEEARGGGLEEKHGHDGVRELVLKFHQNPEFPGRQHRHSQIVLDPDPQGRPGHWQVRAYVTTTQTRPGEAPTLYWCGHIRDTVRKDGDTWRIHEKNIMSWAGEVLARFG